MAKLDPFSAQIVQLVREMPDEAILELVRNKLGSEEEDVAATSSAPATKAKATRRKKASTKRKTTSKKAATEKAAPKKAATKRRTKKAATKTKATTREKAAPKKKAGRKKRTTKRAGGADRQQELDLVERTIRSSKGLSASDIVKRTKLPRSRVSAAVRQLKDKKRIHQGGDRRFARYAADAKTAKAASEEARTTASGPRRKKKR